jgi:hypothetical protein
MSQKIETGVMVMKDGKAWGVTYRDGQSTSYGWIEPEDADISDPRFCTKPTDLTYKNSPYIEQLNQGKIVSVTRTTTVTINEEGR